MWKGAWILNFNCISIQLKIYGKCNSTVFLIVSFSCLLRPPSQPFMLQQSSYETDKQLKKKNPVFCFVLFFCCCLFWWCIYVCLKQYLDSKNARWKDHLKYCAVYSCVLCNCAVSLQRFHPSAVKTWWDIVIHPWWRGGRYGQPSLWMQ